MSTASEPLRADESPSKPNPIRVRAIVWGFLFCFPVCFWNAWQPVGTIYSLLFSTMSALIVLVLINQLLHRFHPKLAFTTADMIVIFGIVSVASAISGEWTFLNMQYNHVFAGFKEREPLYDAVFLKHLPESMYFLDPEGVQDYIAGGHGYWYFLSKFDIWLPKILLWTLLYGCITVGLLSINSIMRDAWLRQERLSFPLVQLPVAMMEQDGRGPIWRSKAFWIAFGVMFFIDMLNGFQYLHPNLPSIPVKTWTNLRDFFPDQPWASLGFMPLALYPFLAALAIFVPSDLLFSVIFFFLARKATMVIMAQYGIEGGAFTGGHLSPAPPYFSEQTWGAVIGLLATAVWVARRHIKQVWKDILTGAKPSDNGLPHRTAFFIFLLCFGCVMVFMWHGDLPLLLMIPYLLAFVGFSFVLTRMRAQLGPPTHEFAFFGPNQLLMNFYGTQGLSDKNAVYLGTVFLSINRLSRSHPMPVQLEAMKMADNAGINQKQLFWLLAGGLFVGVFLGSMWMVQRGYVRGAELGWGDPVYVVRYITEEKHGPNPLGIKMIALGLVITMTLESLRFRFPGFKLHPVGYALSMNFGVDYYWFGLMIALFVKSFVQRMAGLRGYRQLRYVAFGVLVAEYSAELIWAGYAMLTRQSTYTIGFNERGLGRQ